MPRVRLFLSTDVLSTSVLRTIVSDGRRAAIYNTVRRWAMSAGVPILESDEIVPEKLARSVDRCRLIIVQLA